MSVHDFHAICRLCCSKEFLTPIFHNDNDHEKYSTAIYVTAGVQVSVNDGLPQKICSKCTEYLNNCLQFRKNCRQVELLLRGQKDSGYYVDCNTVAVEFETPSPPKQEHFDENLNKSEVKSEKGSDIDDTNPMSDDDDEKPLVVIKFERDFDLKATVKNHLKKENVKKVKKRKRRILKMEHLNNDDTSDRITCRLCQKSLSSKSLYYHMTRKHPGFDDKRTKCEICDKYVLIKKINKHKVMEHGDLENKVDPKNDVKCKYCETEFESKDQLMEHKSQCSYKHKKRKSNERGREMAKCDICDKQMQRASIRLHKEVKHAGLGPVCEHCGRMFANRFRLKEHCRAKHGHEKFKCPHCDFQSAGVVAMRNHERRHRGEKPFVCEQCGAKFHAAYLLTQHRQSHRTEKMIKCDRCPATFKANNSLHMHKITCHSNCLYKCYLCDRTYSCRHYVVKHLRHFHGYKGKVGQLDRMDEDIGEKSND